jgi:hypothetical protein
MAKQTLTTKKGTAKTNEPEVTIEEEVSMPTSKDDVDPHPELHPDAHEGKAPVLLTEEAEPLPTPEEGQPAEVSFPQGLGGQYELSDGVRTRVAAPASTATQALNRRAQ